MQAHILEDMLLLNSSEVQSNAVLTEGVGCHARAVESVGCRSCQMWCYCSLSNGQRCGLEFMALSSGRIITQIIRALGGRGHTTGSKESYASVKNVSQHVTGPW